MTESIVSVTRDAVVTLREVTEDTLWDILSLKVAPTQEGFVAPNSISIAEAYFSKQAWFRAIYADETPVGFMMLHDDPEKPRYYLWRFMIDARYQKLGFGRQAMHRIVEHVKTRPNASELLLSYVPEEGGPRDFYTSFGFEHTGKESHGELEMVFKL